MRAQARGLAEGLDGRAGQGSPADLDDQVVQAVVSEVRYELVAEGQAALDGQAVLRALGGERQRPGVQFLAQPAVGGIAGDAGLARAGDHVRAEVMQPPDDPRVGLGRHEHGQSPAPGPGHHSRRQGRVSAAGDRQVPAAGGVGEAAALHYRQVDEHAHQVPALVRARDVAGLVLDPHPAVAIEAQGVTEVRAAEERGGAEPVAVHGGDRRVERGDQVAVGGVAAGSARWPRGTSA